LTKQDGISKMGSELTSQYKHSTNFIWDDIIGDKSCHWRGEARHKVATDGEVDTSWGESPL